MRFALLLAVAVFLGGASSAALAQPSPAAAHDGTVMTDGPGAPAAPFAHGRHVPLRRAAAGAAPALQRPSEAPLAIDGVATLGLLTGGINGTFVHIGSDIAKGRTGVIGTQLLRRRTHGTHQPDRRPLHRPHPRAAARRGRVLPCRPGQLRWG